MSTSTHPSLSTRPSVSVPDMWHTHLQLCSGVQCGRAHARCVVINSWNSWTALMDFCKVLPHLHERRRGGENSGSSSSKMCLRVNDWASAVTCLHFLWKRAAAWEVGILWPLRDGTCGQTLLKHTWRTLIVTHKAEMSTDTVPARSRLLPKGTLHVMPFGHKMVILCLRECLQFHFRMLTSKPGCTYYLGGH